MRHFIFSSPSKYVQGIDVLDNLGHYLSLLGNNKAFLIADKIVWNIIGERIQSSLKIFSIFFIYEHFNGESSKNEINRLVKIAYEIKDSVVVVGLGGGKTLDTAKAVSDELNSKLALVPTIASTDAPCSALSVIYTDKGIFDSYRFYKKHPELILVDTMVCAQAPVRFFASGIADGLATYIEVQSVTRTRELSMVGGKQTIASIAIASACEKTLLTYGLSAYLAVEKNQVTPSVEAVVESNILLSGLGFENGGLSGAHAIHNAFTAIQGDVHLLTHGEKVAYGTLTHMILEQRSDDEIAKYIKFYRSINMPTTLVDMHLEHEPYENLLKIGELACNKEDTLLNLDKFLTPTNVAHALLAVNAFSCNIKN